MRRFCSFLQICNKCVLFPRLNLDDERLFFSNLAERWLKSGQTSVSTSMKACKLQQFEIWKAHIEQKKISSTATYTFSATLGSSIPSWYQHLIQRLRPESYFSKGEKIHSVVKVYMCTQRSPINGVKATINVQQKTTTNASPSSPYKRDCAVLLLFCPFAFYTVSLMLPNSINSVYGFRETGDTFLNMGKNFPDSAFVGNVVLHIQDTLNCSSLISFAKHMLGVGSSCSWKPKPCDVPDGGLARFCYFTEGACDLMWESSFHCKFFSSFIFRLGYAESFYSWKPKLWDVPHGGLAKFAYFTKGKMIFR